MEVKYVCSLGTLCQSSQILKNNNLKKCSYPFDWIFSNYDIIIRCIEDDFKIFLDKSYYISRPDNKCGHSYYSGHMWPHHDPLNNKNQYDYYVRCVNRFKQLLQNQEHKLFTMIFVNKEYGSHCDGFKEKIIEFNNKFCKYTTNYTLLVIIHYPDKKNNYHAFTHHDNIDFLELHTLSHSNGVEFTNNKDNNYLNSIINSKYKFNL
jgi:hypothetical protein